MKKFLIIVTLYFAQALYTWGTMMANFDHENTYGWPLFKQGPRDYVGQVTILSIVPVGFIVAAVDSNFNQYGWELWWKD